MAKQFYVQMSIIRSMMEIIISGDKNFRKMVKVNLNDAFDMYSLEEVKVYVDANDLAGGEPVIRADAEIYGSDGAEIRISGMDETLSNSLGGCENRARWMQTLKDLAANGEVQVSGCTFNANAAGRAAVAQWVRVGEEDSLRAALVDFGTKIAIENAIFSAVNAA